MAKRAIINVTDFSGGYSSDLPDERMPNNMLRTAINVYWEAGLRKRKGQDLLTITSPIEIIQGQVRAYMNGKWTHILVGKKSGAGVNEVHFYTDNATSWTYVDVDATFFHTYIGSDVDTDRYNFAIMKVNGEDAVCGADKNAIEKPFVIYYDSGFVIKTLEEFDLRTRVNDDWYAGQYDSGEGQPYIDDTTDAQDTGADDFQIATAGTANDGFYVSGVLTFNKFTIHSPTEFDGSPVAVYEFYTAAGTWANLSMVQTPVWGTGTGDKDFEFNIPGFTEDTAANARWVVWDGAESTLLGGLIDRYVIRVRFTTAPTSTQTADYLTVFHSQYLTQIMNGNIPHQVATHNSRLFLAAGSDVWYSPPGRITDWEFDQTESFIRGGDKVEAMVTHRGYLAVFKGASIYGMLGNSVDNWVIKELDTTIGTTFHYSVVVINQIVFFVGTDGYIYGFNGETSKRISKHVNTDIVTSLGVSDPFAVNYQGKYVMYIGADGYRFDPDTMREDDMGDGVVSFWKYAGQFAYNLLWFNGDGDNNYIVGIQPATDLLRMENDNYYDTAATDQDITIDVKTKDLSFGQFGLKKNYNRVKPIVEKAGNWTFSILADHESAIDNWYAGSYDDSVTNKYIDYTEEAHNATANNVPIATGGVNNDGFYIASEVQFLSVGLNTFTAFDGSPVASYQYYKGSGVWGTITTSSTPTWSETSGIIATLGVPGDWVVWDGIESVDSSGNPSKYTLTGKYVWRIRFTTAPTSDQTLDYFSLLYNTTINPSTSVDVTLPTGLGPGYYTEDVSIPYIMDGKDLTLRFQNTSAVFAAIYGYALNVARRVF